ncbi:MAG: glycosyl hydrolase, partial [Monoglobaceae bacterium]
TGNIYNDRDEKTMTVKYSGIETKTTATVNYEIKNENDVVVSSGLTSESLSVGTNVTTFSLPSNLGYGAFYLKLTVTDASNNVLAEKSDIPFSFILERRDGHLNDRVGVNAHFSWGWNAKKGSEVARKAGFSMIRDELPWSDAETEKGVYTFPQMHSNIIDAMLNEGIEPQYNFLYGNALYDMADTLVLPETDEQINAFAEYAYNIVKNSQGKIKYFRVWNEPNHPETNQTQKNAELYMKLLKTVYTRIKPDFPEVQIGAFCTTDIKRSVEFIKWACDWCINQGLDPMDYFDYVSVHHYNTPITLSDADFKALRALIDNYEGGADKEIWCNEYGFFDTTATDWTASQDPHTKAAYASVITAQMLANKYADKCLIYVLADKSAADLTVAENVFGLTKYFNAEVGYAAKPAYVSMTAFNSLTCGYEECGTTSNYSNVSEFYFNNTDDFCDVSMLWSNNGSENTITVDPGERSVLFRDMYGNILTPDGGQVTKNLNGTYSVTVPSVAPIYVIYQTDDVPTYFTFSQGVLSGEIVNIDKATNRFRISGRVENCEDLICAVYPNDALSANSAIVPTADMVYCNQIDTGTTGWFSAEFSLPAKEHFTAVLSTKSLSEPCVVSFSSSGFLARIRAVDKNANRFELSGMVSSGDLICAVYPTEKLPENPTDIVPTKDMVYCNQLATDLTGQFSTEFTLPNAYDKFTAVIGNDNLDETYLIYFDGKGVIRNIITVKQNQNGNEKEINYISDLDRDKTIDVYVQNYVVDADTTPMVICAAYNSEEQLTACKVYEPQVTGSDAQVTGVDIDMSGAAKVKVYLWDRQSLCPIGEYKNIR